MKKIFQVRKFGDKGADLQVCAFKNKDRVWLKNIEFTPSDRFKAEYDPRIGELRLRIRLNDDEMLAIGDGDGITSSTMARVMNPDIERSKQ